ncbi:MAG: Smr/MutS family protein [Bauldia sp.]|nr:Smr/MutS family protein [Bauldia sp.]
MSGGRRRRPLTDEERALWEAVAKTAEPLGARRKPRRKKPPETKATPETPPGPAPSPPATGVPRRGAAKAPAADVPAPRRAPAQEAIDRRTVSRVARGSIDLDGRLDLHGFTQDEAHRRLRVFLAEVQRRGGRMVLVITGKGGAGERGILRRMVPHWLASAQFRPLVSAFDDAHRLHGGGGALYVRIRKA